MTRVEQKYNLILQLGFILGESRRALLESPSGPNAMKSAMIQSQFNRERDQWVAECFRPFITINGTEIHGFWNHVMDHLFRISHLLVEPVPIAEKLEHFNQAVASATRAIIELPADDPDVMVPPKSSFVAYRRLLAIISMASQSVELYDPFLDAKTFLLYFSDVPSTVELKVVTDNTIMQPPVGDRRLIARRDRIVASSELLSIDKPSSYSFLVCASIHDRHLRIDHDPVNGIDGTIYHLGNSLSGAATKDYYTITETDSSKSLQNGLDTIEASAIPWFKPGFALHKRWCPSCVLAMDVKPNGNCLICNTPL